MQVGIDNERARSHRLVKVKDGMFSKTAASRLPSFHVIDFPDADNGISVPGLITGFIIMLLALSIFVKNPSLLSLHDPEGARDDAPPGRWRAAPAPEPAAMSARS